MYSSELDVRSFGRGLTIGDNNCNKADGSCTRLKVAADLNHASLGLVSQINAQHSHSATWEK